MSALGPPSRRLIVAAAFSALWLAAAQPQDRIAKLLAEFTEEGNPVRRAKILPKLGDAQFGLVHQAMKAGDYDLALRTYQQYRDAVRTAEAALKASGINAERKPGGFKQLQIHVRKSLREIDQTILGAPDSRRGSFEAIRSDLLVIDKELVALLFPRQPEKSPDPEKPKG